MFIRIALALTRISYRMGLMFTHKYVDFSAISVMGRRCVAPSLKADCHILDKLLPLLAAVMRYLGRRPAVEASEQERELEPTEMEVNIPKCFISEDWDLVHQALLKPTFLTQILRSVGERTDPWVIVLNHSYFVMCITQKSKSIWLNLNTTLISLLKANIFLQ